MRDYRLVICSVAYCVARLTPRFASTHLLNFSLGHALHQLSICRPLGFRLGNETLDGETGVARELPVGGVRELLSLPIRKATNSRIMGNKIAVKDEAVDWDVVVRYGELAISHGQHGQRIGPGR